MDKWSFNTIICLYFSLFLKYNYIIIYFAIRNTKLVKNITKIHQVFVIENFNNTT